MTKLLKMFSFVLAWVSILGMIFLVVSLLYWNFHPYKVLTIHNSPWPILNLDGKVKRGEALQMHIVMTKHLNITSKITRQLMDGSNIPIFSGPSNLPAGEYDFTISVHIPSWVPPGKYRLRTTYEYDVNPIRLISYPQMTQPFEVVE